MFEDIDFAIQGYRKFKKQYYDTHSFGFDKLVKNGQKPKILVIACSDSRVDPAIILNSQPGDLFVIRNVANIVPPYEKDNGYHGTSAALEFGICILGIKHIVILGHSECGGITQLIQNVSQEKQDKNFINKWIEIAKPACNNILTQNIDKPFTILLPKCIQHSILNSLNNLETFPWIKERLDKKQLFLHGWYFDLLSGSLKNYSSHHNSFIEISEHLEVA